MPDSGSEQEPGAPTADDGYDHSVDARLATGAELGGPDLEDQLRRIHGCSRRQYQDAQKRTDAMLAECFGGKCDDKDEDQDLTLELPPFIDSAGGRFVAESVKGQDGDAVCKDSVGSMMEGTSTTRGPPMMKGNGARHRLVVSGRSAVRNSK